jgi:TatA/E family protein of Tat protein translocase
MNETLALLAIGMPGTSEMLILAGIILLFVGPKKLPELARSLGGALTAFREGMANPPAPAARNNRADAEDHESDDDDNEKPASRSRRLEPPQVQVMRTTAEDKEAARPGQA